MVVTMKDIAKKANISTATVSRVLNNPEKVSDETRRTVENAINELNYKPNALARGLVKRSTSTIGILIPDINNIFYPSVIRGIDDELERSHYGYFLCNTDENVAKEKHYINSLLERRADGIIIIGTRPVGIKDNEHIVKLAERLPVVLVNDFVLGSQLYCVMTDEVNGAYKAVSYLAGLGHTRIAFINGEGDFTTYKYKHMGYERALMDYGINLNDKYIIKEPPYENGGYKGAKKLIAMDEPPTAIFTASDQIAIGVYRAIFESGFSVPQDFSVVGFSGTDISGEIYPGLTTVNQFPYRTGQMASEMLIRIINGERFDQKKLTMETELIVRNSCGPADERRYGNSGLIGK